VLNHPLMVRDPIGQPGKCGDSKELRLGSRVPWFCQRADTRCHDQLSVKWPEVPPAILNQERRHLRWSQHRRHPVILLYDLISTYFEVDANGPVTESSRLKAFGYSRDKRPDCVQIVIALIITPNGLPIGYAANRDARRRNTPQVSASGASTAWQTKNSRIRGSVELSLRVVANLLQLPRCKTGRQAGPAASSVRWSSSSRRGISPTLSATNRAGRCRNSAMSGSA